MKNGFTKFQQRLITDVEKTMLDEPADFEKACEIVANNYHVTKNYVKEILVSHKLMVIQTK